MADFLVKRAFDGLGTGFTYKAISANNVQVPLRFGGAVRSQVNQILVSNAKIMFGVYVEYAGRLQIVGLGSKRNSGDTAMEECFVGMKHSYASAITSLTDLDDVKKDLLSTPWSADTWHWVAAHVTSLEPDLKIELEYKLETVKTKPTSWTTYGSPQIMVFEVGVPEVTKIGLWQYSANIGSTEDTYSYWDELFVDQLTP